MSRLHKLKRELSVQVLKAHVRKLRLEKQHQAIFAKFRVIGDKKAQNIFKLEVDKILSKVPVNPAEILNPFSP
jgi:hypothetical protein